MAFLAFGTVLFCIPQTFDYNLSSSRKRSIIGSFAVKTAYLVPRRAKVGVYRESAVSFR